MTNKYIEIKGAREGNLKGVDIKIRKNQVTAFVGVSGSGKTSLVHRTIGAEAQNQMNDTYPAFIKNRLPKLNVPNVDSMTHLSPPVIVNQKSLGENERSTVGTVTDINSSLRLLFSRFGHPFVGYSDVFSFNSPNGMCLACEGLGRTITFIESELIDFEKSLNQGAINFPTFEPGSYRWHRYVDSGFFNNDKKIKDFSEEEMLRLLHSESIKPPHPSEGWYKSSEFEGLIPRIIKTFIKNPSKTYRKYDIEVQRVTEENLCPECQGYRLNQKALSCKIEGKHIAEWQTLELTELLCVLEKIKNSENQRVIETIIKPVEALCQVGLGYLSLSRSTNTLSGGESQRVKLIKYVGSRLSDLLYIMDEPSTGLHPHDLNNIKLLINQISQNDNTVLMIDHDEMMISQADEIIEIGPKSGKFGGKITYQGDFKTWHLRQKDKINLRREKRQISDKHSYYQLKNLTFRNLKHVSGNVPKERLTAITGVAGSGKSSFVKELRRTYPKDVIIVDQKQIKGSRRSTIASYVGIYDRIRTLFAKSNSVKPGMFSFNGLGGCSTCKGKGFIETEMAFMEAVKVPCEACETLKFKPSVLKFRYKGKNIVDVLEMSITESLEFFKESNIRPQLEWLEKIGVGYLSLGQTLDTLSGGELQRLKLTLSLEEKQKCFVLDEPTTGLSDQDLTKLLSVIEELLEKGNTVLVIEHNMLLVRQCDWMIDFGPGSGKHGGQILFEGLLDDITKSEESITKNYLS